MSNCPGCDNSSTTYSRCNPPVSTNCVFYQGDSKVCGNDDAFTICKGDNLSSVQMDIFNKICTLIGDIDITAIQIPGCFYDSWNAQNPKESDKTLLNLLSYMLDIECQQKTVLDQVHSSLQTLDPQVQICLSCCTPEGSCSTTATLLLSQALQKIVDCICLVKAEANAAQNAANAAMTKADLVYNAVFNPTSGLSALFTDYTKFRLNTQCRVANLETVVQQNISSGDLNGCSSCTTCPTYP